MERAHSRETQPRLLRNPDAEDRPRQQKDRKSEAIAGDKGAVKGCKSQLLRVGLVV